MSWTWACNSPRVLHDTYTHLIHGHRHTASQQIEQPLRTRHHQQPGVVCRTAASPVPVRQTSAINESGPTTAHGPCTPDCPRAYLPCTRFTFTQVRCQLMRLLACAIAEKHGRRFQQLSV